MLYARSLGVCFAFADEVELRGVAAVAGPRTDEQITILRHDAAELTERWSGARPERTREVRGRNAVLLSVDHDYERGYLLTAPGIGSALIGPDASEVLCAPGADSGNWHALLVGQILPLVATLRGREVFHAAGVGVCGRAYLLCGPQGIGKTSLAVRLVMAGAQLLSDDVIAIDERMYAYGGQTVLHVREAELQLLSQGEVPGLRRLGMTRGRATFVPADQAAELPLSAIYLLERADDGELIERRSATSALDLLAATFNLSVRTQERLVRQLELCGRITEHIPIFRARVVPGCTASELAAALLAHTDGRVAAI